MNKEEKDILRSIAQALEMLPSDKKERAVGYAEGVIIDDGEESENREMETIQRNSEEGGENVLKAEYEEV